MEAWSMELQRHCRVRGRRILRRCSSKSSPAWLLCWDFCEESSGHELCHTSASACSEQSGWVDHGFVGRTQICLEVSLAWTSARRRN
eukprot:s2628_g1.t1